MEVFPTIRRAELDAIPAGACMLHAIRLEKPRWALRIQADDWSSWGGALLEFDSDMRLGTDGNFFTVEPMPRINLDLDSRAGRIEDVPVGSIGIIEGQTAVLLATNRSPCWAWLDGKRVQEKQAWNTIASAVFTAWRLELPGPVPEVIYRHAAPVEAPAAAV